MSKRKKTWEEFEKEVGKKRQGKDKGERSINVPNDINVQRMSANPSGRLKKYEPLDTRDYVPFNDYDELSIENIKDACETFYNAPTGSCDILASDRGPSCNKMEQLKGKKVFFVRFLPPKQDVAGDDKAGPAKSDTHPRSSPASPLKRSSQNTETLPKTVFPKSISVTDLLKAGKLVKPPKKTLLYLEYFDVKRSSWQKVTSSIELEIQPERFAWGAFRDAFKARCNDQTSVFFGDWVVKKYQTEAISKIKDDLNMKVEDHTRKQVQMHAVARSIAAVFTSKAPKEFGESFEFSKVYYSNFEGQDVTVEEFVEGTFHKYVNNDGFCVVPPDEPLYEEIYEKAQCLCHFSYVYTDKKMMLLDLQGAMYNLYDPEISTTSLCSEEQSEIYFCAGNLSSQGIERFLFEHICNKFCKLMGLPT